MLYTIITILVLYWLYSKFIRNRGVVHLALSNFKMDSESEDQVIIEGRKTGLWQWILVQLKLGNIYQIKVHKNYMSYSENSARGELLTLVPIKRISSTTCGYEKPLGILILGCVFVVIGFVCLIGIDSLYARGGGTGTSLAIASWIIAAVLIVWYIYSKNFIITIESMGSQRIGFSFKRSFIENIPIEIEKIKEAIEQINKLVIESK